MVKDKNLSSLNLFKSIYSFDLLKAKFSMKHLGIYNVIILVLISIINYFKYSSSSILNFTGVEAMLYTFVLLPVLFLSFFVLFHTFIVSFEKKTCKKFWISYLNFSTILIPFILLGHILTTIPLYVVSYNLSQVLSLVLYFMMIYTVINLILNIKNYYNISVYISFSSFLLTYMVIMSLVIVEYLSVILSNI